MRLMRIIAIGFIFIGGSYPNLSFSYGPIVHIGHALKKLNDPATPKHIREIINKSEETRRAFKAGALDGDILNFMIGDHDLPRKTHELCSASIAITLMNLAENGTDVDKAYAYGWALVHLPGDIVGHPLVNRIVGGNWNYDSFPLLFGTNGKHIDLEKQFDRYVIDDFGFNEIYIDAGGGIYKEPLMDLGISIPVSFLWNAIYEAYGEAVDPGKLFLAEALYQAYLHLRAIDLANTNYQDNPALESRFRANQIDALDEINNWMNNPRISLNENYNLDTGMLQSSQCPKPELRIKPFGLNTDHPDDRFDVSTLKAGSDTAFEEWFRLGTKKGISGAYFFWKLRNKLRELNALPLDISPDLRFKKKTELIDLFTGYINNADIAEAFRESNPKLIEDLLRVEDVGVLDNGFSDEMAALISTFREPVVKIPVDFTPDSLKSKPVLIVPSGGFYGLKNSQFTKMSIEEYVQSGGVLIVLTQQHGYDFSLLPVPEEPDGTLKPLIAVGWNEDQACSADSVFIENYHQILSGQRRSTPSINVDGYFIGYPSASTILLRRTANGQPAMLMYDYGQGKVIVTSMYSDFAYSRGQASSEEVALIRDLIAWAKRPDFLPEFKPGQTGSTAVQVTNFTDADAFFIKLIYLDPSRKVVREETRNLFLPARHEVTVEVSYEPAPNAPFGIYHIDYVLLDAGGAILQPQAETDTGRFVISNPPRARSPDRPIWFSISTTSQDVLFNTPFDYTFHIFNNTDETRHLAIKSHFRHTGRPREWKVTAPPKSETAVSGSDLFTDGWWFFETMGAELLDESGKVIGSYELSFKGVLPYVRLLGQIDRPVYFRNDTAQIQFTMQNAARLELSCDVKVTVFDPEGQPIHKKEFPYLLRPGQTISGGISIPLDASFRYGTYGVWIEAFYGTDRIARVPLQFDFGESRISIHPVLPTPLVEGENRFSFFLENNGIVPVGQGVLDLVFKDPQGNPVYSGKHPFGLPRWEKKRVDISVPIPSVKFGKYTLFYTQSDESRVGTTASLFIWNDLRAELFLDQPSYKAGETAKLRVDLKNFGKFQVESLSVSILLGDWEYIDPKSHSLSPQQALSLSFAIPIPADIYSGPNMIRARISLPSGDTEEGQIPLVVQEPVLVFSVLGSESFRAGQTYRITATNIGGSRAFYFDGQTALTDEQGLVLSEEKGLWGSIGVGETVTLAEVSIPAQAASGPAFVSQSLIASPRFEWVNWEKRILISGLEVDLKAKTDKEAYFRNEDIQGMTAISTSAVGIDGGSLRMLVSRVSENENGYATHFLPKGVLRVFRSPTGVAVGPDRSVYVLDDGNRRIRKFDSQGNEIHSWTVREGIIGVGQGEGDIAVGPDGSVYVALGWDGVVKRYDRDGRFISQYGGWYGLERRVAVGPDGSVYLATNRLRDIGERIEYFESYILKLDPGWRILKSWKGEWGGWGVSDGCRSRIEGIAVGPDGTVYVVSTWNDKVEAFDPEGNPILSWGSVSGPKGMAAGLDGSVYVLESNYQKARVLKFDREGRLLTQWGSLGYGDGQFDEAEGIAVGPDGTVYVADTRNGRVGKFNADGGILDVWGMRGNAEGRFSEPQAMAFGPDGSIYVLDRGNERVQKFDPQGNFLLAWGSYGSKNGEFSWPLGIAVGPDGSVYVADAGNGRVQKFDSQGAFICRWETYREGMEVRKFSSPMGVAVSAEGLVYVLDGGSYRVQQFDSQGNWLSSFGGVHDPRAMAVDGEGLVYVLDGVRVVKYDSSGNYLHSWGGYCWTPGPGWDSKEACEGLFNNAQGIAIGADGSVFVADAYIRRIHKFSREGDFIASWGSAASESGGLYYPEGVSVGKDGLVYVVDSREHRVRKFVVEELYQAVISVDQTADTLKEYGAEIGRLEASGKLYFQAALKNSLGQTVGRASYPFYVFQKDVAVFFQPARALYKPGESVEIKGWIENRSSIPVEDLVFSLDGRIENQGFRVLQTEGIRIPAWGTQPFSAIVTAGKEGTVVLTGKVFKDQEVLAEVADRYRVTRPTVKVSLDIPSRVGNESFTIGMKLANTGLVDLAARLVVQDDQGQVLGEKDLLISVGDEKRWALSQKITARKTYFFHLTGDVRESWMKTIYYSLNAFMEFQPEALYAEGKVEVPFRITNFGSLGGRFEVTFLLHPSSQQRTKTYYLGPDQSLIDTIYFELAEGDFQIIGTCQAPEARGEARFKVRKENQAAMGIGAALGAEGSIAVQVYLTNQGANAISGSVDVRVRKGRGSAEGDMVWNGSQSISDLHFENTRVLTFNVNPSAFEPGTYLILAELKDNGGTALTSRDVLYTIAGPDFQITQAPSYQTFNPGDEAQFIFKVKNTGSQEGLMEFSLKSGDQIDLTKKEWLKAGEEKEIAFAFPLPEDLEAKDYFASYEIKGSRVQGSEGSRGQIKYHLAGISLNVTATLNKENYKEGETARLNLAISSPRSTPLSLFARVNYAGFEAKESFILNGQATLPFFIPLPKITGEKLFFGIYHESGRSIHLNSLYIHKVAEAIAVRTDKQVYKPGERVSVSVSGTERGNLTLSGPGGYSETFPFTGSATRTFSLPALMTAGTYYVSYQLSTIGPALAGSAVGGQNYTGSYPFDVAGIQVKVKEARLDKAKYASADTIHLSLTIESNQDLPGTLKIWVVDPEKKYTLAGSLNVNLAKAEPLLATQSIPFQTNKLGLHRLVYGLYSGEMLLCSGAEAFDMGEAVILGLTTDQADYPTGQEPIIVNASLMGSVPANLELILDGQPVLSQMVSLSGFGTASYSIPGVSPGPHSLRAVLTSGGLTSTKEASFLYGTHLPDLTVFIYSDPKVVDGKMKLTILVRNQGKRHSYPTKLYLYDGLDPKVLLASFDVNALDPGGSQSFDYFYDCMGKAGGRTLAAWLDTSGGSEFSQANNEAKLTLMVPALALATTVNPETAAPGSTVVIKAIVMNFSGKPSGDLKLITRVEDSSGSPVYIGAKNLPSVQGGVILPVEISWTIDPSLPHGTYAVGQSIEGKEASSSAQLIVQSGRGFSLSCDAAVKKAEVGEGVAFHLTVAPAQGFSGEVGLSPVDCPSVFTAVFAPNPVNVSSGPVVSVLKVHPTAQVQAKTYGLTARAVGGGYSQELPLSIQMTDFELKAMPERQAVRKLDGAVFTVSLLPVNGFEGEVSLGVEGIPRGMWGHLSSEKLTPPATATLTLATSKWLAPGEYALEIAAKGRVVTHSVSVTVHVEPNPLLSPKILTVPVQPWGQKTAVRVFDGAGNLLDDYRVAGAGADVHVSCGDVDGDGLDEIIAGVDAVGWWDEGRLRILRGSGSVLHDFRLGYHSTGGLTVAAGDLDGDWVEEIAVGSYVGDWMWRYRGEPNFGRGMVKIYKVVDGRLLDSGFIFYPFEAEGYAGTPNVAFGDVDGDGIPELIITPGLDPRAPAQVKVFKIDTSGGLGKWRVGSLVADLHVHLRKVEDLPEWLRRMLPHIPDGFGAKVAAADLDGDGRSEIILGSGPSLLRKNQVVVIHDVLGSARAEYFVAYPGVGVGVNVAVGDLDGDGIPEVITGPGPGFPHEPKIKVFRKDGTLLREFPAYPRNFLHGIRLATGWPKK